MAFAGGVMTAGRRAAPRHLTETPREVLRIPQAVPPPEASAAPVATPSIDLAEEHVRLLQTQVQMETSVLAALRNQADQARQELADLQQQKATRAAPGGLQRRQGLLQPQDAAPIAPPKQPFQQDPQLQAARPASDPEPSARAISKRVVIRTGAKVRVAPNKVATVQRTAPEGAVLKVYGRSHDGWVQVGDDAPWGWIYSTLLSPAP